MTTTNTLERFRQAVRDVADHLDGWTARFDELEMRNGWARAELAGPDGMAINLRGADGERWSAWGIHPGSSPREPETITQTWTRPAKALASDLSRRLLPVYAASYAEHLKIDATRRAEDEAAERLARRATEVLPGMHARDRNLLNGYRLDPRPAWEASYGPGEGARVVLKTRRYGNTATLEISDLDEDTTLAILGVIAKQQAAKRAA